MKRIFHNWLKNRQEVQVDQIPDVRCNKLICLSEALPNRLPRNFDRRTDLPSDRMQFGYSFQDVPGLELSACKLVEIKKCIIEMALDEWDSVFTDVKYNNKRVKFRGSGIPPRIARDFSKRTLNDRWDEAALSLEVWSGNYAHWLIYHMPKLMIFAKNGWKNNIILPERGRWSEVEERDRSFLSLIEPGLDSNLKLLQGRTEVNCLAIIDGDPHHPALLKELSNCLLDAIAAEPSSKRKRLYISRSNAGRRKILNEENLILSLKNLGFEAVSLELMSIEEQIKEFSYAECIVAPHGAGLANIIFCQRDTKIVEIITNDYPCPDYYRLATIMQFDYYLVISDAIGSGEPTCRDIVVSIDKMIALLSAIL